jgi:hypothetical protein
VQWHLSRVASPGVGPTAREAKMPTLVSPVPGQCTRNVAENVKGNKVTDPCRKQGFYYAGRLTGDKFSKR